MLDIKKVKQMLENGEEVRLECVGSKAMVVRNNSRWEKIELDDEIKVVGYDKDTDALCLADYLYSLQAKDFHHFKIVGEATTSTISHTHAGVTIGSETTVPQDGPTFGDLIDVVVKAYKNRLLDIFLMNDEVITVFNHDATGTKEGINRADTSKYYQFINFINSLYTETFVIESEEDEMKIRQPVKSIILANGEEIINEDRLSLLQDGLCLKAGAAGNIKIPFSLLKGATITQKIEKK